MDSRVTLTEILNKYDTDKNETFHNYGKYYERHIASHRLSTKKYLEIGVFHGESLKAMREYFCNAEKIVGIDINPDTKKYEDTAAGVYVEIGNQSDTSFLQKIHNQHGSFDVILDDGSHVLHDMVTTFQTLFPLLNDGGIYILEDTICIRDHMDYFFALAKHVNHWEKDTGSTNHCVDPFKFVLPTNDPMKYSIREITFTNSAIIVHKEVKTHWIQKV